MNKLIIYIHMSFYSFVVIDFRFFFKLDLYKISDNNLVFLCVSVYVIDKKLSHQQRIYWFICFQSEILI